MVEGRVFRSSDLTAALRRFRVVPVVTLPDPAIAVPLADALGEEGLACLEIAFRAPNALMSIEAIRVHRPEVLVGAGTILTIDQADAALGVGATFVVAPGTNPRLVEHVLKCDGLMVPGVATPSEIEGNLERGLRLMKFFPAQALGGIGFLTSVRGPFPDVEFVPTGGINASNFGSYLGLPNVAAVGGTWLASLEALQDQDLESVRRKAREAVSLVADLRASGAICN